VEKSEEVKEERNKKEEERSMWENKIAVEMGKEVKEQMNKKEEERRWGGDGQGGEGGGEKE